jgi:hypothetical protein
MADKQAASMGSILTELSQVGFVIFWMMSWLFTVGFAKLGFWAGLWAFFVWPYYFGARISG